jgi:hypothetical protein
MIIRSLLFGREKAVKSLLDAQNLSGSSDMVRHELDAPRQSPARWQKIDRLDSVPAVLFVDTRSQLTFLREQHFRLIPFQFGSGLRAAMRAKAMSVNKLIPVLDWVSWTTTMLDFIDFPSGPLRRLAMRIAHTRHPRTGRSLPMNRWLNSADGPVG